MTDTKQDDSEVITRFTDSIGRPFDELIPPASRNLYQKALSGTCSPRQAIKAFCLRCVGYTRPDVTNCTATKCPLHPYRPFQKDAPEEAE